MATTVVDLLTWGRCITFNKSFPPDPQMTQNSLWRALFPPPWIQPATHNWKHKHMGRSGHFLHMFTQKILSESPLYARNSPGCWEYTGEEEYIVSALKLFDYRKIEKKEDKTNSEGEEDRCEGGREGEGEDGRLHGNYIAGKYIQSRGDLLVTSCKKFRNFT